MKKFLVSLLLLTGNAFAQDTTPNLIGNTWNNVQVGSHPNNCCTGGPAPLYDPNTNTIHFSYGQTAVHQVIGINTALQGTGIQINGWNWGYDLRNMNGVAGGQGGTDTINATSFITNDSGQIVQQSDQFYNTQFDWTRFSGTENLNSPLLLGNNVRLGIQFVSRDSGFWAGYYGPQVRNVTLSANYGVDQCTANPLHSTSCPGYAAAYLSQQCTANALFDPSCPGYTTAQCNINPLFTQSCPGYAAAYYSQQCSINALYDPGCPGYAQAYLNYQCSLDSLYSNSCPGYQQAYFNQQCSLNPLYNNQCQGYADAYYVQQCNINPLYDAGCTGYASAYHAQQCSLNSLYSSTCPGYAQAYFNQQCSLNGLYDRQCPNYAQAYAAQQLLNPPPTTTQPVVVAQTETSTPALVPDATVNEVITTTATSASPAQAATATVPLAPAPAPTTAVVATVEKKEETKDDTSKSTSSDTNSTSTASSSDKKDEPKSTRQQLAERRLEAARAKAVEEGKNLANKVGEAATMEAQVAVQNVVLQAMGFTPGFDAYGKAFIPDGAGYKPFTIYNNQKNVDNARMMRGLTGASDRTHAQMVDSQYR